VVNLGEVAEAVTSGIRRSAAAKTTARVTSLCEAGENMIMDEMKDGGVAQLT